jgi:hypothetical protein
LLQLSWHLAFLAVSPGFAKVAPLYAASSQSDLVVRLRGQNRLSALHNYDRYAEQFCRHRRGRASWKHAIAVAQSHLRQTLLVQLRVQGGRCSFPNELSMAGTTRC